LINPNIFLPVNLTRGRTHGMEARMDAPTFRGLKVFAQYSLNYAQAIGGRVGGFTEGEPPQPKYFFLDHDQRHSVFSGATYDWEKASAFATLVYSFGSGFPDASEDLLAPYFAGVPTCATPKCRLPAHSTLSLSLGKNLWKGFSARFELENLTNRVYPINLGSEFNGSHVSPPREVAVRLSYNF
jgi:outer membrane receptor protein involved in Fe transport